VVVREEGRWAWGDVVGVEGRRERREVVL